MQEMFNSAVEGYSKKLAASLAGEDGNPQLNLWELQIKVDVLTMQMQVLVEQLAKSKSISDSALTVTVLDEERFTRAFIARVLMQRDAIKVNTARIVTAIRKGFRPNSRNRN